MTLTVAQKTDVRRFAGYRAIGNAASAAFLPPVFIDQALGSDLAALPGMTLEYRLNNLETSEEELLLVYLTQLSALELGILTSADSMDISVAGPTTLNPRERQDREALFNSWRRKMCAFIGVPPGPGLGNGTISLVRA